MKKWLMATIILAMGPQVWAEKETEYCRSLLKPEEVASICVKQKVKMSSLADEGGGMVSMPNFPCALEYTEQGADSSGRLILSEPATIRTVEQAHSSFESLKDLGTPMTEISGVGDRAAISNSNIFYQSTMIIFVKKKHYLEMESRERFCSEDGLKKIAAMAASRLP